MPSVFQRGNTQFSGMEIIRSNFEAIEDNFFDVLYTVARWRKVLPPKSFDGSISPGATLTSYLVQDVTGSGAFVAAGSGQVPTIGRSISKPVTIHLAVGRVAAFLDDEEVRNFQYGFSSDLRSRIPEQMAEACNRHVEGVFFYGISDLGFEAWMDYPECDVIEAALNASSTSRSWYEKTADEILKDVDDAIAHIWAGSKEIHIPDHIWLPTELFALITTKRISEIDKTVMQFIKENNLYTSLTGNPLTILPIPHLSDTGTDNNGRIVFEENMERNHFMPWAIPFTMRPPLEVAYGTQLLAEYKFGSYHNRYPKSMVYLDFPTV